jgi:hypothetical protein
MAALEPSAILLEFLFFKLLLVISSVNFAVSLSSSSLLASVVLEFI